MSNYNVSPDSLSMKPHDKAKILIKVDPSEVTKAKLISKIADLVLLSLFMGDNEKCNISI